jgi:tetratricopeptide (TPR) repeat protein
MENSSLFLLFILVLIPTTRALTVLFHELGHAIPAIFLTKQTVRIYLGSHGDPKESVHIRLGLLDVWFKYNPLTWQLGLCVPTAEHVSINKQIIYTIAGPLASFVIAIIASYFAFAYDLNSYLKISLVVFLCSSIYDLFMNLTPKKSPIKLYDGKLTYNDGHQLKQLFHLKRLPKEFMNAIPLYNEQKFEEAAILLKDMLNSGIKNDNIYRLAISSFLQIKDYQEAKNLSEEFILHGEPNSDDFANAGFSYSQLDQHDKALEFYDKSLQLNPENKYSLNNKGYTLNILDRFQEAITLFDKAIEIDNLFAYSYNNRGLAKIKTGRTEEGLEDINRSFELDENNSYGYRNLGIYHLDQGEYAKALDLFRKAKELDDTTHMIDDLINKADKLNSEKEHRP